MKKALLTEYGIEFHAAAPIVLQATTPEKYSAHIILKQKDLYWPCITELLLFLQNHVWPSVFANQLFTVVTSTGEGCLVDVAVYRRNQQFRLAFCSKYGQSRPLRFTMNPNISQHDCEPAMFLRTLVCCNPRHFQGSLVYGQGQPLPMACPPTQRAPLVHYHAIGKSSEINRTSPFPLLDTWVTHNFKGISQVRLDRMFPLSIPVIYFWVKSRFCYHIQGNHDSNHVIIAVDVLHHKWWQICFATKCSAQGKQPLSALPAHLFQETDPNMSQSWVEWLKHWQQHFLAEK